MQVLLESFESSMHVLQELAEKNQRRVDKLEHVCTKREEDHRNRIKDLEATYTVSSSKTSHPAHTHTHTHTHTYCTGSIH